MPTEARKLLADLPRPDDPDAAPELVCERLATHDRDGTANAAGVPLARLREHAAAAVEACGGGRGASGGAALHRAARPRHLRGGRQAPRRSASTATRPGAAISAPWSASA